MALRTSNQNTPAVAVSQQENRFIYLQTHGLGRGIIKKHHRDAKIAEEQENVFYSEPASSIRLVGNKCECCVGRSYLFSEQAIANDCAARLLVAIGRQGVGWRMGLRVPSEK